jgi:Luciferase-like monooxygenase
MTPCTDRVRCAPPIISTLQLTSFLEQMCRWMVGYQLLAADPSKWPRGGSLKLFVVKYPPSFISKGVCHENRFFPCLTSDRSVLWKRSRKSRNVPRPSATAACGRSNAYCIQSNCKGPIPAHRTGTFLKSTSKLSIRSTRSHTLAQTKTIKLGTSVLDMPYYSPVMLARRLTTLDVLSNGRLCVGLGLGWNKDEMDATGADMTKRGALADEFLPLLKAIWTTNPVEFHGKFFNVPKSYINLKPVQKPYPPIYRGAFVPAALKRLALLTDGWNPVFLLLPVMAEMFGSIRQMAKEAGRDPSALEWSSMPSSRSLTSHSARTGRYFWVPSIRSVTM